MYPPTPVIVSACLVSSRCSLAQTDRVYYRFLSCSGVALLALRRDGFVSVFAPFVFPAKCDACERVYDHIPTITTVPLLVPSGCPLPRVNTHSNDTVGGVVLRVNLQTSVVGFAMFELQHGGDGDGDEEGPGPGADGEQVEREGNPVPGYELDRSDHLKGNFIDHPASWWRGSSSHAKDGHTNSLSALAGRWVAVKVVLTDADLFSLTFDCM
eukprot:SAG22_NODE_126_length_18820_cov_10.207788_2_plen_212_part_00